MDLFRSYSDYYAAKREFVSSILVFRWYQIATGSVTKAGFKLNAALD